MNRAYRLVFNRSLGVVQAVSERATSRGKSGATRRVLRPCIALAVAGLGLSMAAPGMAQSITVLAGQSRTIPVNFAAGTYATVDVAAGGTLGSASNGTGAIGVTGTTDMRGTFNQGSVFNNLVGAVVNTSGTWTATGDLNNLGMFNNTGTFSFSGIFNTTGTGRVQGDAVNNGHMRFQAQSAWTYGGSISGTGDLLVNSVNGLALTGASTFSGGTLIDGGRVLLGNMAGLGTGDVELRSGAELLATVSGTEQFNELAIVGDRGVVSAAPGVVFRVSGYKLRHDAADATDFPALTIGSPGNTGIVEFASANGSTWNRDLHLTVAYGTYRPGESFAAWLAEEDGVLDIGPAGTFDAGPYGLLAGHLAGTGRITNSVAASYGSMYIRPPAGSTTGDSTFGGVIDDGAGHMSVGFEGGTNVLRLKGENTYTTSTYVVSGTVVVGDGGTHGSVVAPTYLTGGSFAFDRSDDVAFNLGIFGTGMFFQRGTGTVTLGHANTYDGGTVVERGHLGIGDLAALGTGDVRLQGGAELFSNLSGAPTFGRVVLSNDSGTISAASGQTLRIDHYLLGATGADALTIGTAAHAGTVEFNAGFSLDSGFSDTNLTIANGTFRPLSDFDAHVAKDAWLTVQSAGILDTNGQTVGAGGLRGAGLVWNQSATAAVLDVRGALGDSQFDGILRDSVGTLGLHYAGENGSTLTLTRGNTYTGGTTIAGGTLRVGNGLGTGDISGDIVNDGVLAVDRTGNPLLDGVISGSGVLRKSAAGTLTLNGNNTYTGNTEVLGGRLIVAGALADTHVTVASGATLAGTGTIGGPVDIGAGATLAGVSGATLTTGSLALDPGATVQAAMGVGAAPALFHVTGDLRLDGTLDVYDAGGFGPGVYRVFAYDGALDDQGLVIGHAPGAVPASALSLTTGFAHQVTLVNAQGVDLSFWDGGSAAGHDNAAVDGGAGEWHATGTRNWTSATGLGNGDQQPRPGFAVFGGAAGNVQVVADVGDVEATGLQFAVDGYRISGAPLGLVAADSVVRVGDGTAASAGMTATIDSVLTGIGALRKTDRGTLVLNGANTYSGGTTIDDGTVVGHADSFGAGALTNQSMLQVDASADATLGNRLAGNGTFTKTGAGTLRLTANSFGYTGATTVASGSLIFAPDAELGGTVSVAFGALIGGNGRVGNLDLRGTLSAGQSIGTFYIANNVDFRAGSTWLLEADADGRADTLDIGGHVTIDPAASLRILANGTFGTATDYAILGAGGGVSGQFGSVSSNFAFLTPTLAYTAGAVRLSLVRNNVDFAAMAVTANQRAAAGGVQSLGAGSVYDALVPLSADAARAAFDSVSGEAYASTRAVLLDDRFLRDGISQRLGGETGGTRMGTGTLAWAAGSGAQGRISSDGNAAETKSQRQGFMAGVDHAFGEHVLLGVAAGSEDLTSRSTDRTSRAKADATHVGVYAQAAFGALALDAGMTRARYDVDMRRTATVGVALEETLVSRHDADATTAYVQAGWSFGSEQASVTPYLAYARTRLDSDAAAERGGGLALAVAGSDDTLRTATAGVRGHWTLGDARDRAQLAAGVAWQRNSGDLQAASTQQFMAGGDAFTVYGIPLGRDSVLADAGIAIATSDHSRLTLSATVRSGDDQRDLGAQVNWRVGF